MAIIEPHDEWGGWTPAPRKERPDSKSIALAKLRVKKTTIDDQRFGSSSPNITRSGPAPWATDASMNSFSRRASTSPRRGRAM